MYKNMLSVVRVVFISNNEVIFYLNSFNINLNK